MAGGEVKKIVCRICGTEHKAGDVCPECEWDETVESRKAKGEAERKKMREEAENAETKRKRGGGSGIWS